MSPPRANPSPRPRWEASGKVACGETAGINPALGCTWHFSKGEGPLPCGRGPSERREGVLMRGAPPSDLNLGRPFGNHALTGAVESPAAWIWIQSAGVPLRTRRYRLLEAPA